MGEHSNSVQHSNLLFHAVWFLVLLGECANCGVSAWLSMVHLRVIHLLWIAHLLWVLPAAGASVVGITASVPWAHGL